MVSKNNHYLNQQKSGRKFEKYSIKKLKVGAASVLVGAGFFFGYHVEASEVTKTESVVNANNEALGDKKINTQTSVETTLNKESRATEQPAVTGVVEEKKVEATISQAAGTQAVQALQTTELQEKVSALQTEINRIRSNEQQKSQIEKAEKLVEEAKLLLSSNSKSQKEVDAKSKEISSLTNILKSIKTEEVTKENKNKDSRNGKKMEEGTGFRTGTEATTSTTTATGIAADVVDATETPAVKRPPYTETRVAEGLAKQIAWLDFSDTKNWSYVDIENGNVYLKEGSIYEKEIMPNYRIKLKVKSLKPFQATEIYRKRMEANNATPEEKATFNPNATNGPIDRTDNNPVRITAKAQDQWSEIRDNGINTNGRKTSIIAERLTSNVGVQFEISGTYKGNVVRPAVVMADAESANPGENIVFTTNGSGWQQIIDLKKNYTDAHRYKPLNYYTTDYKRIPDASWGNDVYNTHAILNAGDGNKIVPKFFTSPDQETGGLGTGVFGPGVTAGKYSVPVVLTKNATEVGLYVFSSGAQAAMIGVAPIDEGDAPKTYGEATHTMNTRDGLTGVEVKQPYLGSERPDADTDTPKNWHGDDDTDTADEGINQLLPDSLKGSEGNIIKANISEAGYYTLNVQAHTGGAERAFVRSWLDFNGNGKFDEEEASDIAEITEDGDVTLHFRSKTSKDAGSLLQAGTRVRIATSRDEIENPTGLAFSGEVEDFNAKITHPPKGDKQTTIGNAIIGNNVEKQSTTVHFTPKGKNIYTQDDVDALIDTNVAPIYINNKTKKPITLSEENTYTVIGQGTYKFTPNGKDVDVEFTPAKGFVGKAHGITIRRQDTNKTTTDWGTSDEAITPNVNDVLNTMDGLYIPEVIKPTVEPTVNNAESINLQGFSQKGKPTFTVATSDTPVTASAKHPAKLIDPRTNTVTDSASVDALDQNNNVVGTYRIVPETGEVTFTPNVDFKGSPKPVGISVPVVVAHDKDDNDITVTKEATYAPRVVPVEPFAEAATTSDVQGKQQVSRIVLNTEEEGLNKTQTVNFNRAPQVTASGEHVELNTETLTLLDASGAETNTVTTDQGVYVLDKVGQTITFTPKKEFVGTATAVNVQIKDMNGTKVKTTYTPTVIEVTPTGKDSATSGPQGLVQTSPIVFNQRDEEDGKTVNFDTGDARVALKPETLRLLNGTDKVTSIKVENVGTYELVNNAITFTPVPTYYGTAEGVTVQVEDENGKVVTKKYVPTVTELVVRSEDKTSTNIQGESQEGTPVFNIPTESNNARVTGHTLVDPSDNREKESVTVAGKGTFTIDGNGKVTFTPLPIFKGDVDPITVKATVTITNAKNESATITKTATYKPIIVSAEIDKAPATSRNLQGLVQTGTPTFTPKTVEVGGVQKTITVQPNSYKLVKGEAESESLPAYKAGTTEQIGTYAINPATGVVTFTPTDKTYTGAVEPVSVQATGSNGVKVQTTYTPEITPVTPTKEPSATTDVQGKKQVSTIVLDRVETDANKDKTVNFNKGAERGNNGEQVELDPNTLTLVNDAGAEVPTLTTADGEYVLDKTNRTITFTPNKNFVGPAKPVKVQIKDVNGTKVETTYTPTVTDVTITPKDKTSEGNLGKTQTGTPEFEVSSPDVRITGYKLLNPTGDTPIEGNEFEDPEQGTYRINPTTGQVTFIPKPGFKGEAKGIKVRATDENGETADAKYTPTVNPFIVVVVDQESKNIQGLPQEETPTFTLPEDASNATITSRKLVDPADPTNTPKDTVTLDGKGTFRIDGNGKVTFTPEPAYTGDVPSITVKATITVTNDDNDIAKITSEATYRPIIIPAELEAAPAKTANVQGAEQTGRPEFTPHTEVVNGVEKTVSVQPNSYKLVKDGVEVEGRTTPAYKKNTQEVIGKYTINVETGEVTFTPTDKAFKGEVEPATVQATGSNGVKVKTSYTPTIIPVTPSATDASTTKVQGATQEGTVTFTPGKATIGSEQKSVPMDITAYKLLGGENGTTPLDKVPAMSEDGTKQVGTYTIKVVDGQPVVTFTPTDKAYAGKLKPVTVQGKDTNGSEATATYTPVITPIIPTSENGTSSGPQGVEQTGSVTFNPGKEPGTENTPVAIDKTKMTLLGTDGTTPVESLEVSKDGKVIGTYTLVKDPNGVPTGEVKFTPTDKSYVGEVPAATVQVKDANGTPITATYTPTFTEVNPTSKPSETTGFQGLPQTSRVVLDEKDEADNTTVNFDKGNDKVALVPSTLTLVDASGQKATRVTVDNEGTYELNNGVITFTPLPTFHGKASGVSVQAEDVNGKVAKTTYTPTVTEVTPKGTNVGSEGIQGAAQSGTPTFTSGHESVTMAISETNLAKLVVDGKPVADTTIPAKDAQGQQVGTYTIEPATGKVTFTPNPGFTGTPVPATVEAKNSNGTPATATYTPVVKEAVPSGDSQVSSGIQGAPQTATPVFTPGKNTVNGQDVSVPFEATSKAKLIDPSKTGEEAEVTTLVVENQGTYTIDDNGVVTFTPLPTFKGEATEVSIVRKDKNGTPATAKYKPTVVGVTPSATVASTTKVQGATQEVTVSFTPGKATIGTEEKTVPMDPTAYKLLGGENGTTPLDKVPAMSEDGTKEVGTYTIKVVDGQPVVTFTPTDKTYAGKLKPVTVQGKDTNGTEMTTTYTPVITPIVPTAENGTSSGPQGVEQTGRVTFNPGKEPGTENTPVEIDKSKMTLLGTDGTTPVESLEVSKDGKVIGTYTLVKDPNGVPTGEVKFTPTDKSYVGEVPPATVQVQDANGTPAKATYTPTLTEVTPKGTNVGSEGIQGAPQSGTPTFTSGHESVTMTISETNPAKLVVDGQPVADTTIPAKDAQGQKVGTYTIEPATGKVTFTPNPGFTGTPVPATVEAKNSNGTPATATYTPVVKEAVPSGDSQVSSGIQGAPQTATPVFTPGKNTVNGQDVSVPFEATSKAKLIDPSKTGEEAEVTTLVVENQGTYTIDDNGVVTFTPLPTFKGEATEVSIVRKDKNGTPATAKYKPTVVGVTPSATVASTTKVQGATQEVTVSFTPGKATIGTAEKSVPMDPNAYKLLGGENGTTPLDTVPAMSEDGTKQVGTYTIKVVDGQPVVTFTPTDKAYAGKLKPVTVQGKDTNGTEATTTYTPVITPIVPTAENGISSGPQGVEQTGRVTFNPGKEPGTENTPVEIDKSKMTLLGTDGTTPVESLEVSKDGKVIGTYTLVKDPNGVPTGEVKFTPTDKSYVGEVPPATVQVQDANGTPAKGTYTPTLTKVTPTGKDTTSTGLQGKVQTGTPTFTPGTPEVPMDDESPATFEDGNNTKTIDKVGTYTVAKDGTVTFTPDKDFVGEAPEVTVKRVDKNGTAVTAKYKPIVAKVLPTGEGSETEGAKGRTQTSAVVFDKKDEDKSTVNFNKGDETVGLNPSTLTLIDKNGNPSTEVKVPGEGTYTLANNVITFTPEKDFAGKATGVTLQVKDINGTPLEKTYTPTVRPVTTFVDPAGNVITVDKNNKPVEGEVDGSKQPTKDIYGYKFVRTETDNKGNTKHIYEQAEGKSVKVTYVSTTNETLSDSQTVETKDKFIGTDYDASIEALKLERIEKDGKVYLLKERKSDSATENGKLSDKEQTVTYVYEEVQEPASNQKYGNVVVVYKDKFGRPISGTTDSGKEVASTVIDTPNSPLTTKYDTTDHKPQIITTKDGKKYKLIKVLKSSDAEKSGVKARTSVITYVYESLDNTTEYPEAHIGLVLVNYLDEEGNPISGKTPEGKVVPNIVVDTEADLVGKDYDTTDHKVSTIIVENGDVYELLKVSETSVEKGKLTEGTINVDYIYHKVVTKFVDENGKEIKSPEKGRMDKKDIPEYTFKETKKDVNGNTVHVYTKKSSSTPVTPTPSTPSKEKDSLTIWKDGDGNNIKSPEQGKKEPLTIDGYIYERSEVDKDGNTVHIYRKVSSETPVVNEKETLFVDANGKPLQPAKKGQHPHETIPGYEFVRTETDANGNVRHVYRPVAQSQATVNPSPTVEQRKNELPNTGTGDEFAIFGAAAASILAGLGIAIPGKKKEEK